MKVTFHFALEREIESELHKRFTLLFEIIYNYISVTNLDSSGQVQLRVSAAGRGGFSPPSPSSIPILLKSRSMPSGYFTHTFYWEVEIFIFAFIKYGDGLECKFGGTRVV